MCFSFILFKKNAKMYYEIIFFGGNYEKNSETCSCACCTVCNDKLYRLL